MFRRPALALVAVLALGAAACGGQDDAGGRVDTEPVAGDLAAAVSSAQTGMPVDVPDSRVRVLLEDLCAAGATDADGIVEQLAGFPLTDAAQADAVMDALGAGTAELCPGDVAPGVQEAVAAGARAAAPSAPPASAGAVAAPSGAGTGATSGPRATAGSTGSTGSSTAAPSGGGGGSSSSGGAPASSSSGSAAVGSGNASGSGNQSSTNFGQHVTSDSSTTTSTP